MTRVSLACRIPAVLLFGALPACGDDGAAGEDGDAGDPGSDGDGDGRDAEDSAPPGPWVRIIFPEDGSSVDNPVVFVFEAGGGVATVAFEADGWPLQGDPIPAGAGTHAHTFSGVNFVRHVVLTGHDALGTAVATDEIDFTPVEEICEVPDPPGFNHYVVEVLNDHDLYPKDGTWPYCWAGSGDVCPERWGMVYDGMYGGETLFPGGGDCFCTGHALEVFLRAYRLWQRENGVDETVPFEVDGHVLTAGDVRGGDFYQHWQGYGVAGSEASSANAFESAGIGENLWLDRWDEALPGDFINISRSTGSGHSAIFVSWILDGDEKVGIRYYGCNTRGQSCPDPDDPTGTGGNSGPSFATERFDGMGGTVLSEYLFVGRVYLPTVSP